MPETGIFTPIILLVKYNFSLAFAANMGQVQLSFILRLIDNMLQGIQRTSPNPAGTDILYQA